MAEHRPYVLGLCHHRAAYRAHNRQPHRCLVDSGANAVLYLAAVCIVIVERVATFSYFIPTMVRLTSTEGLADGDIKAALSQWLLLNHGRHVLTLAGWLAALKALSLSGRPYGNG
jgi:hypothetical protein